MNNRERVSSPSVYSLKKTGNKPHIIDYKINLRCMLVPFYTETGGLEIANVFLISGISGGNSWERNFSRGSPVIAKGICTVCWNIITEALHDEMNKMVHENLKDKLNQNHIDKLLT